VCSSLRMIDQVSHPYKTTQNCSPYKTTCEVLLLFHHSRSSNSYCACHWTEGLWVQTWLRTVDFYGR
jgi:hypothetical protein